MNQTAMPIQAPVIVVENLVKRFGDVTAVGGLSFTVGRGEILGLLGPNGAGKSTTIQLMLGLTTATSGNIQVLGLDIERHRMEILKRVNFSSAYTSLPGNLTVWENMGVFARLYGLGRPAARIRELLDLFEIGHLARKRAGALSLGQATRLNLCKAFLNRPEVLFLDEPTSSLDPDIAAKVREVLLGVQRERGVTIIWTSHNMREVEQMCHRVIFIARGRLVAQGRPEDVAADMERADLEEVFITIARETGELKSLHRENDDVA